MSTVHVEPTLVDPADPIERRALEFHRENPHVLEDVTALALRLRRRGLRRWSINAAFEVARYDALIEGDERCAYKLNNNHRACYARWIMRDVPALAGFFATRVRAAREE